MYGYIYLTTNLINNKKYIGRHQSDGFDSDYYGSGKILTKAVEKYGIENFKVEILSEVDSVPTLCESFQQLCESERFYIDYYDCINSPDYYNLIPGGLGGSVKGSIGIHKNGSLKFVTEDELETYLLDGYEIGGITPSAEVINSRRQSNIGKKRSEESRKRMSQAQKGHFVSDATKQKYRESHLGKKTNRLGKISIINDKNKILFIDPEELSFYETQGFVKGGIKHIKEGSSFRHSQAKSDTTLIYKDGIEKCIKRNQLQTYVDNGWIHGRLPEHILKTNPIKGKIAISKDGRRKYIKQEELEIYLAQGYIRGYK